MAFLSVTEGRMAVAKNGKKLLIVEDQSMLAEMYRTKFEMEGYGVLVAYDGMEAVSKIPEFLPDAVLLDLMMPQMDGFETLDVIRKLAPSLHMKIIIFSNLNDDGSIERCRALGADDYVVKVDATPRSLYERVERHLSKDPLKKGSLRFWWMGKDEPVSCDISISGPSDRKKVRWICPHCGKSVELEA